MNSAKTIAPVSSFDTGTIVFVLPNHRMKADAGFAAECIRAAGWQSSGFARGLSLNRRRSLCGMLGDFGLARSLRLNNCDVTGVTSPFQPSSSFFIPSSTIFQFCSEWLASS